MPTNKRMCVQCVLLESTPGIDFDENGVCNYCRTHVPMKVLGEEKLKEILESFRNKNKSKKYDCLAGISGGRDSTYTLWKLVHDYKMRVLAFHYKLPWRNEQSYINLQNALKILNVDCVEFEMPNDIHRKGTIKAMRAWSHHPSSIMIPIVCAHCKTLWPWYFKIARDHDIPLLFLGSNPLETASFKKPGFGGARTYHKMTNLPKIVAKSAKELLSNPRYLTSCSWALVVKMYLMASHSSPYLRWKYKDIAVLRLFDYIPWNEKEVMSTIEQNLGWRKSPEVESFWRFDCRLDYVRRIMYAATVGVTELRDLFSKMIRENQMTREEAIERLKTEDAVPKNLAEDILKDFGLTLSDLNLGIDLNRNNLIIE